MTKFCPKCGAPNEDDALVCSKCGYQLNPMKPSKIVLAGVGTVITLFLIFLTISLSPWFTWSQSALSDLGVHPYGYIFNSALIFEGIMNTIFILYLFSNKAPKTGSIILLVAGIFLALVGVFTESFLLIHWAVAIVYFIFYPIGIIAFTFSLRKQYHSFYLSSFFLSIVSLVVIMTGVFFAYDNGLLGPSFYIPNVGLSVFETTEALLIGIWSAYLSLSYYYAKIKF